MGVRLLVAKEAIPPAKYTDRPTPRNRTEQVHHLVTHTDKSLVPVKTNKLFGTSILSSTGILKKLALL